LIQCHIFSIISGLFKNTKTGINRDEQDVQDENQNLKKVLVLKALLLSCLSCISLFIVAFLLTLCLPPKAKPVLTGMGRMFRMKITTSRKPWF
jgi:hypothetical protein